MTSASKAARSERRSARRRPVSLLVQYRFDPVGDFVVNYSTNLSRSGIFLNSKRPPSVGEPVYLQFAPAQGKPRVEGLGVVTRVSPPTWSGKPAGMGIRFISLDSNSMTGLEQICETSGRGRASFG